MSNGMSCVVEIRWLDFDFGVSDKARINACGGRWQGDSLPLCFGSSSLRKLHTSVH